MEGLEIRIAPEKVIFRKNHIAVAEPETGRNRIFYKDIVRAYIRIHDETGGYLEPEIMDIARDTEGELVLCAGKGNGRWIIRTDRTGQKAGALFEALCLHAPYILAGGQEWFDGLDEEDFGTVGRMVDIMRECYKR